MRHFFSYAIVTLLLAGCTTTRYIPVESVRTDSVYVTKEMHDTLRTLDSVYVEKNGDTVRIERWRTQYKSVVKVDTLWMQITDSIKVPYEVVRYKEEKPSITTIVYILLALLAILALFRYGKR